MEELMKRRDFLSKAGLGVTAGVIGASTLSTPAISGGHKTINVVSTWPRDFPGLGLSAQRLSARITELSEGKLKVNYFAAGEKVGAFDVFDEVASGNSQAYIAAEYYWKGKHAAFNYFTSVPFGMTTVEWNAWIKFGGGQKLWDDLSGEFGLKALPCGGTGTQAGGWFNKEINSGEDLKGLKMRIPGLGGPFGVRKVHAASLYRRLGGDYLGHVDVGGAGGERPISQGPQRGHGLSELCPIFSHDRE